MENPVIVVKYGGSALADSKGFREAGDYLCKLQDGGFSPIAVVSAKKGVSDLLIKMSREKNPSENFKVKQKLREAYHEIIDKEVDGNLRNSAHQEIEEEVDYLSRRFERPGLLDRGLASGEDHAGIILKYILMSNGVVYTKYLDGGSVGVVTNQRGGILEKISKKNILEKIGADDASIPIIGGYIGICAETKKYKLLGRNTTDVVAALVACAVNAEIYENIKGDVPGVYKVQPEFFKGEKDILKKLIAEKLSYDEARQITWRGAKVVHPLAIKIAKSGSVPIEVKSLGNDICTLISKKSATTAENPVAAISAGKFYLLDIMDDIMDTDDGRGYLSAVTKAIADCGANILDVDASGTVISMIIPTETEVTDENGGIKLVKGEDVKENVSRCLKSMGYNADVDGEIIGGISITGDAMKYRTGTLQHLSGILANEGISITMGSQRDERVGSPVINFYVNEHLLEKSVRAFCSKFFLDK